MTNMTFKMLCLLMLNKNLLIFKFAIAIPTPGPRLLLLLASHLVAGLLERLIRISGTL